MTGRKKQHNKWHAELGKYLANIVWCEKCGDVPPPDLLDIAHRVKRRFIGWNTEFDRREYFMAAKLCRNCHTGYDEYVGEEAHERMFSGITEIVGDRDPGDVNGRVILHPVSQWGYQLYEKERQAYDNQEKSYGD